MLLREELSRCLPRRGDPELRGHLTWLVSVSLQSSAGLTDSQCDKFCVSGFVVFVSGFERCISPAIDSERWHIRKANPFRNRTFAVCGDVGRAACFVFLPAVGLCIQCFLLYLLGGRVICWACTSLVHRGLVLDTMEACGCGRDRRFCLLQRIRLRPGV